MNPWRKLMTKKRLGAVGVIAAAAIAVSGLFVPSANANNTIVVWADGDRGPNLEKVLKEKGDWVSGYTITVKSFSNFDALKDAFDKATDASGPDIVMGANDWVPTGAKSGKLAPITLTASQKARFTAGQLFDLTYKGKLYGVPVDVNNVAMIYNTDLVKTAPKTFGEMVALYKANKASKGLKAGLCVAGGGMSWGAHSIFSALGADAYQFDSRDKIVYNRSFNGTTFGKNVRTHLLDGKKSNGFLPASDAGCKDNFLDGKVPYAIIGNWEWKDYVAKGFTMNLMPVPGVVANKPGKMFGSVSGALLTTFAAKHGVEAGAKSLLTNFFGSTDGQVRYQKVEGRPPAEKGAALDATVSAAQRGFGAAATLSSLPQIGAFLNNNAGGANYWDSAPAYWTAVLVDGKDAVVEGNKLAAIWRANTTAGKADL
ncbi:MAG: extracellular solute-binding protein [Actinobacteria bacterium]|jgi:arabinogalactan oligomer / maltooligosaccharide transport system substrate-binding protein|nr:extracellular solute-binding protein [Actinomycetota bacterium]